MIKVEEDKDGAIKISWDKYDPMDAPLNDWTEEDFIDCLADAAEQELNQIETSELDP